MGTDVEHTMNGSDQQASTSLLDVLRRRLDLILAVCVVAAGAALLFSLLQDKKYTSSASMALQAASTDPLSSPFDTSEPSPDQRDVMTNFVIAARDVIVRRTTDRLDRRGQDAVADAVSTVGVSTEGDSDLIKIEATASDPKTASRAANAVATQFVAFGRNSGRLRIRRTRQLLRGQIARLSRTRRVAVRRRARALRPGGRPASSAPSARRIRLLTRRIRSLESRSEDLAILASVQTGNLTVIERATPAASPSSPKPVRNTLIGAFAGLLLGIGLALMREQQDRRVRDSKELESAFGLPVLARVPESKVLGSRSSIGHDLPPFEADGFRTLRTNLRYFKRDHEIDSVLITSPVVDEGKSTIAFHLAAASAATGAKVLLIEADIRKPTLAQLLGLPPDEGLSTVLAGEGQSLADVCHQVLLAQRTDGRGSEPPTLDVVLAGRAVPDASELIESERMRDLILEARRDYSLVVIDTPPAGLVSDAIPLMNQVSAVVVVGRIGKLTSEEAGHLRDQLQKVNAPTVGVVANFTSEGDGRYRGEYETGLAGP
jgi:capsular exopolysaccharide synthesis family protein